MGSGQSKTYEAKIEALSRRSSNDLHPLLDDILLRMHGKVLGGGEGVLTVDQHQPTNIVPNPTQTSATGVSPFPYNPQTSDPASINSNHGPQSQCLYVHHHLYFNTIHSLHKSLCHPRHSTLDTRHLDTSTYPD